MVTGKHLLHGLVDAFKGMKNSGDQKLISGKMSVLYT